MIPALRTPDSTVAFLGEGYRFISRRCERLGSDGFRTRIALRPVTCLRGPDAARFVYEGRRFSRTGALPPTTQLLLQDVGSVQTLEDVEHEKRKLTFLHLVYRDGGESFRGILAEEWQRAEGRWRAAGTVTLHGEMRELLTRAVTRWAGVPLPENEVGPRTKELGAMIENAGRFGPRNWAAIALRHRTERWARGLVREVRAGRIDPPAGSAVRVVADARNGKGDLLPVDVAAVELLNILRPTVAVARFVVFAALVLHDRPDWRHRFASGDLSDLENFAQEVRRRTPFFPVVGATARQDLDWNGTPIRRGGWVLLDLYGTNHHPDLWPDPTAFRPERFRDWSGDPDTLIPQGGGTPEHGHRCPGEPLTMTILTESIRRLVALNYTVPEQDLRVSLRRMPALPASGFVLEVTPAG